MPSIRRPPPSPVNVWALTQHQVTLPGETAPRRLFQHRKTGEKRIRKMVKTRDGDRKAKYVKVPKALTMKRTGGSNEDKSFQADANELNQLILTAHYENSRGNFNFDRNIIRRADEIINRLFQPMTYKYDKLVLNDGVTINVNDHSHVIAFVNYKNSMTDLMMKIDFLRNEFYSAWVKTTPIKRLPPNMLKRFTSDTSDIKFVEWDYESSVIETTYKKSFYDFFNFVDDDEYVPEVKNRRVYPEHPKYQKLHKFMLEQPRLIDEMLGSGNDLTKLINDPYYELARNIRPGISYAIEEFDQIFNEFYQVKEFRAAAKALSRNTRR